MSFTKNILIATIKKLSNELDTHYSAELNFRNHCYLRIAYDATIAKKWNLVIKRPFTKYASEIQLQNAIDLLLVYKFDKKKLLKDNEKSLEFRKKTTPAKSNPTLTLF